MLDRAGGAARQGVHRIGRRLRGALLDALGRTYHGLGTASTGPSATAREGRRRAGGRAGPRPPRHARQPQQPRPRPTWPPAGRRRRSRLHEATLKLCESKLGPDHPDTLMSRNDLAVDYWSPAGTAEAIALHEETLKRP